MNPTPEISALLPDERTLDARRDALVGELRREHGARDGEIGRAGGPRSARRRGRAPRRLILVLVAILALGAGAAAASGLFSARDVAVDAGIGCYEHASLDHYGVAVIGPRRDPVAACAALWRSGDITGERSANAPPLVACSGDDQPVRVLPGRSAAVCARLGLNPLPDDYAAAGAAGARAEAAVLALDRIRVAATTCPSPRGLAARARARLAAVHRHVRVAIDGDAPCAGGYATDRDHVIVTTVSRRQAALHHLSARIDRTLAPLDGGSARTCRAPREVAAHARRLLDAAALHDVHVTIEGHGPCTGSGYATDPATRAVTIRAISRAEVSADAGGA